MDNPAGCPRDHPQAVGCPQAPQGSTTTIEERQERNTKALQLAQASTLNASSQRRSPTRQNQPHPYNIPRATQPSTEIGHVPEITGHLRRNTQQDLCAQARSWPTAKASSTGVRGNRLRAAHGLPVEGPAHGALRQRKRHPQALPRMGGRRLLRGSVEGWSGRVRPDGRHRLALAERGRRDDEGATGTRSRRTQPDGSGGKKAASATCWWTVVASRCRSSYPGPTSMTASGLTTCSPPSWSSARIRRIGETSICAPTRATAAPSTFARSRTTATSPMSLAGARKLTSSNAIRPRRPAGG